MTTSSTWRWGVLLLAMGASLTACLETGAKDRCRNDDDCLLFRVCNADGRCEDAPDDEPDVTAGVEPDAEPAVAPGSCESGLDCDASDEGCNVDVCMVESDRFLGFVCADGRACPTSQACISGYCLASCATSTLCDAFSDCVDDVDVGPVCAPSLDATCDDDPCDPGFTCVDDICVVVSDGTCDADVDCGRFQSCTAVSGVRRCVDVPFCDRNGDCDVGGRGALCNDNGVIDATKAYVCVAGACLVDDDCAEGARCLPPASGAHGRCTLGRPADPCVVDDDCNSSCSTSSVTGVYGLCQ